MEQAHGVDAVVSGVEEPLPHQQVLALLPPLLRVELHGGLRAVRRPRRSSCLAPSKTTPSQRVKVASQVVNSLDVLQEVDIPVLLLVPRESLPVCGVAPGALQTVSRRLANLRALVQHRRPRCARHHQQEHLERRRVPLQHPERPRGVMRVKQVHQHRGVCASAAQSPLGLRVRLLVRGAHLAEVVLEPLCVHGDDLVLSADGVVLPELEAAADKAERTRAEGVVHQRVEVVALTHAVGSHAEELAHGHRAGVHRADPAAVLLPEFVRDLDGVVESPPVDVELFHPPLAHVEDVLHHALVVKVELWQVGKVPPALVVDVVPLHVVRPDGERLWQEPPLVRRLLLPV